MIIHVPGHLLFKYLEVWKIDEYKDGCVFKTHFTGKSIFSDSRSALPSGFETVSFSGKDWKSDRVKIDLVSADSFK